MAVPVQGRADEAPSEVHLTSRPLASFSDSRPETPEDGRPQLVVDGFAWTEACDQLCHRSLGVFDDFLSTLISQIAEGRKTIGMVGIDAAAGGTTVALCLARLLAAKGLKTAVVDANFERPEVAEHLGVRVTEGWNSALSGTVLLGEVMIESLGDRLTLVPLSEALDPRPLLAPSLRASLVWRMLREPHEVVLVDCGDLSNDRTAESLKQLSACLPLDAVYMVCDKRTTTPQELINGSRRMKDLELNLLGTIENFIE
jgi:Mrp family chromosome partitioning ATPase